MAIKELGPKDWFEKIHRNKYLSDIIIFDNYCNYDNIENKHDKIINIDHNNIFKFEYEYEYEFDKELHFIL